MKIFASKELSEKRYDICKSCDELRGLTKTCKVCNCIMPIKVKLLNAECPLQKWTSPINSWS